MEGYSVKYFDGLGSPKADQLFICGMGGSGLPGEIVNSFHDELGIKIPITIWKDYGLPPHRTKDTLFVFISFSGDTAETISGLKAALKIKGSKIAVLTGGGELKRIAEAHKVPFVTFDKGDMMPRFALNPMFGGLVKILRSAKVTNKELSVPKQKKGLNASNIVKFIDGGIPLVYTSAQLKSLAYIWKIWLNETAKTPAFINQLPELDHNEIVGFESRATPFRVIFIQDPSESKLINKRIAITGKLIGELGGQTLTVKLQGKTRFERFWNGVYLGEAAATRLATVKKRDLREIRSIDALKARMKG